VVRAVQDDRCTLNAVLYLAVAARSLARSQKHCSLTNSQPIIDELSAEYGDKLRAVKLNTDESPGVATEYGIRSIPTVMVFKDGVKMDAVIGAVPKSTLVQTIEKYLN
jgi:thioredoxin-like negative regulator of GroEL